MNQIGVGTFTVTNKMRRLVNEVLDSGRISYGPMSQEFEQKFASIHSTKWGVLSNSGTSSLQVALQALKELHGWEDWDEVIVPAVTFVATVNIVLHNRMKPVLVDVDPVYYELDPDLIEDAITPRTRCIIPVHLFGHPCDMTRIAEIAERRGLKIIEDSCECMFVTHAGRKVGSWGDIGCFSTYVAHLLSTGVGGMATTNHRGVANKMRSLVNHGRDGIYISIDDDDNVTGERLKQIMERRFRFESIGHSFRITELESALGVAQLDDYEDMIETRQLNARYFNDKLASLSDHIQLPRTRPDTEHAWMMYPVVRRGLRGKGSLTQHLEECGIETREMLPLTNQPAYRHLFEEDDYPVAKWINQNGFYVASHQNLTPHDMDRIVSAFRSFNYGS